MEVSPLRSHKRSLAAEALKREHSNTRKSARASMHITEGLSPQTQHSLIMSRNRGVPQTGLTEEPRLAVSTPVILLVCFGLGAGIASAFLTTPRAICLFHLGRTRSTLHGCALRGTRSWRGPEDAARGHDSLSDPRYGVRDQAHCQGRSTRTNAQLAPLLAPIVRGHVT